MQNQEAKDILSNLKESLKVINETDEFYSLKELDYIYDNFKEISFWNKKGIINFSSNDFDGKYQYLSDKLYGAYSITGTRKYNVIQNHKYDMINEIENYKQYFSNPTILSVLNNIQDLYKTLYREERLAHRVNLVGKELYNDIDTEDILFLQGKLAEQNDFLLDLIDSYERINNFGDSRAKRSFERDYGIGGGKDYVGEKPNCAVYSGYDYYDNLSALNFISKSINDDIENTQTIKLVKKDEKFDRMLESFLSDISINENEMESVIENQFNSKNVYKNLLNNPEIRNAFTKTDLLPKEIARLAVIINDCIKEEVENTNIKREINPSFRIDFENKNSTALGSYDPFINEITIRPNVFQNRNNILQVLIAVSHEWTHALDVGFGFERENLKKEASSNISKLKSMLGTKNFQERDIFLLSLISDKLNTIVQKEGVTQVAKDFEMFDYYSSPSEKRAFNFSEIFVENFLKYENEEFMKNKKPSESEVVFHNCVCVFRDNISINKMSYSILDLGLIEKNFEIGDIVDEVLNKKLDPKSVKNLDERFSKLPFQRKEWQSIEEKCDKFVCQKFTELNEDEKQKFVISAIKNGNTKILDCVIKQKEKALTEYKNINQNGVKITKDIKEYANQLIEKENKLKSCSFDRHCYNKLDDKDIINLINSSSQKLKENEVKNILIDAMSETEFKNRLKMICIKSVKNDTEEYKHILKSSSLSDMFNAKELKTVLSNVIYNDNLKSTDASNICYMIDNFLMNHYFKPDKEDLSELKNLKKVLREKEDKIWQKEKSNLKDQFYGEREKQL